MRKLLISLPCFLWISMMTAEIVQLARSYFSSIFATISKYRQKIQDLMKKGKTAEESLEKDIPKRHSRGKLKKTRLKDNKNCLHNVGNVGKYIVAPDPANIDPKYLDPVSTGKEGKYQEDNYGMKEVPSNRLSDASSIVCKSRPPERVKKRITGIGVSRTAVVTVVFGLICGASAESVQNKSRKVGQNVTMEIPEDIAGDFPFFIQYTPNNNSSKVTTLCTYSGGSLSTSNPNNSHQGISCLPKGVFISSTKFHHAGTYTIILDCTGPDCPRFLICNLSINGSINGNDEPLLYPILYPTTDMAENITNKADVGGGGSNKMIIILAVITALAVFSFIIVAIVAVRFINHHQRTRILNLFLSKKSTNSSNVADTADSVHCRMISASSPTRESAEV